MKKNSAVISSASITGRMWDPVAIEPKTVYYAGFGTLEVWIERSFDDWYLASRLPEQEQRAVALTKAKNIRIPEGLDWKRWVSGEEASVVRFLPAMPDRSVVVRPRYPLHVPTGTSVPFFVNIPLWVRVTVGEENGNLLCEIPSVTLSNTWFGEPTMGELCYSLKTKALRNLEEVSNHPYMATCPVRIQNQAPADLDFQRICIRVEHLHVYRGKDRLWTNQVDVVFKGEDLTSQVTIRKYAPVVEKNSERLCPARQPVDRSLLKRSFYFLRSLTGF